MKKELQHTEELKEIVRFMEEIVVVIDKIGSSFDMNKKEEASALLLFFNERNVLDKLSKVRKYLYQDLENKLPPDEYNTFIENDITLWLPPYGKTQDEILERVNSSDE